MKTSQISFEVAQNYKIDVKIPRAEWTHTHSEWAHTHSHSHTSVLGLASLLS